MCHSSNNKLQSRISSPYNGCVNGRLANGVPNGYNRTSDVQQQLNTSDRVMTEKIEMFRDVSYYVIHEGQSTSPFVILKKVN